ncbi:MAG TPA: zinc ribbon domain-containing protein [Thermoanaerobaculia bacterium]|nr:zinc ribbon domain-containing protein [Thermoanaerobaculia bacterium]
MPIYEFYCPDCHTVFSFFSPRVETQRQPACPRCGRPELPRRPSAFALVKAGRAEPEAEEPFGDLDDERMEGAMASVFEEMGEGGEEDPKAMARMLRRFGEVAGMEPGPKMEEMLRRLEAGEDPESLEEELGGDLGEEDAGLDDFFQKRRQAKKGARGKPRIDKELYPL